MTSLPVEQLRELQSSFNAAVDAYAAADQSSAAQAAALSTIDAVVVDIHHATKDPFAEVMNLGTQPVVIVAARVAIELNLFQFITENTSINELSEKSGAEKQLLVRLLRPLVVHHFINQPTETTYSSTPAAQLLKIPGVRDWIKTCFDLFLPAWVQIPKSLRENSYHDITSFTSNPTILAYGENIFDVLSHNLEVARDFFSAQSIQDNMPTEMLPHYPFDEDLDSVSTPDSSSTINIVDVGGGNGILLARIHQDFPKLTKYGKNILQDLPHVVTAVPKSFQDENNFTAQAHDFFTPQPVKGARYYNLRSIIHDWPDDKCREILLNIREAMRPGFSKIVIDSFVIREIGYGVTDAQLDLVLTVCCGRERTMKEYEELLGSCGFKVGKVISAQKGDWKCIEALVDESWQSG